MGFITNWWAADRPHWQRTSVLVALLAVVVTVVLAVHANRGTVEASPSPSDGAVAGIQPADRQAIDIEGGWGPARKLVSMASGGAPFPSFNCVIDNPNYGDERQFMMAKEAKTDADFSTKVEVRDGGQYEFRILVNNCGPDKDIHAESSWIQDATVKFRASKGMHKAQAVTAYLTGSNATNVWANVGLWSDHPFRITDSPRDVVLYSNAHPIPGLKMGSSIFSNGGFKLGYEEMDGKIRPGYQYASYVYVTIGVEFE